jgi:hypothetical protein
MSGAVGRENFDIRYAAHTGTCTFLLDAEGICRRVVTAPHVKRKESQTASRCVGAQYVASLDATAAGCLVEMPRVGSAMLFARVDERGRVSLVRTGAVTRFEHAVSENPFDSVSVKTSAPEIAPRPAPARGARPEPASPRRATPADDDAYFDGADRTVRINALRPADLAKVHFDHGDDALNELATAEYTSAPSEVRESSSPRTVPSRVEPPHETLVAPRSDILTGDEDNPYDRNARGMLPASKRRDSGRSRSAAAHGAARKRG